MFGYRDAIAQLSPSKGEFFDFFGWTSGHPLGAFYIRRPLTAKRSKVTITDGHRQQRQAAALGTSKRTSNSVSLFCYTRIGHSCAEPHLAMHISTSLHPL
jgi:hypothetical protein